MAALVKINYSEVARRTGKSREHIRLCFAGKRNPGVQLQKELQGMGFYA